MGQVPLQDTGKTGRRTRSIPGRAVLGAIRRGTRAMMQRMLHAKRRTAAFAGLRELGRVERVLFVCHGNIYRSPYAEAAFRSQLPEGFREQITAVSGGFVGPGRPAPDESQQLARTRGLDLSEHRSQLLTPELVRGAGLVVVMSPEQAREVSRRFRYPGRRVLVLGDLDPEPIRTREITDPWHQPFEVLESSTRRAARCTRPLADLLLQQFIESETED